MATLLVEELGHGIYIHRAHGDKAVKTASYIGQRVYLHNTTLGNAIMLYLSGEHVDEIVDRYGLPQTTESTITSRSELHE